MPYYAPEFHNCDCFTTETLRVVRANYNYLVKFVQVCAIVKTYDF